MSAALPGNRALPASQYDLATYWGRVKHAAEISDPRMLLISKKGLEDSKELIASYKLGKVAHMSPELWHAKKVVDATIHPDTGEAVMLPFRMSSFVLSNLIVTAGMLTPGLGTTGTLLWQITNQSLNVAINNANANKSTPLSTSKIVQSYLLAVGAVVLRRPGSELSRPPPQGRVSRAGALNVFLMRGEEIRMGIDVYPALSAEEKAAGKSEADVPSLGKSRKAATIAVSETALSRVLNSSPVMVIPALALVRLQKMNWLKNSPRLVLPVNLGLILTTSLAALPFA
ncbi:hypothetical protein VE04_03921, partial [Pseudogymnoascus sp. 24MN13]